MMDFDIEKHFSVFDEFFKKRPEVRKDHLKRDLQIYYLPYVKKLVELKNGKPNLDGVVVGVSAIQGTGKTTQGEVLEILLRHLGFDSVSLSIDDHYITHNELTELRERDPRFIRRGVTHDIPLGILNLRDLKRQRDGEVIIISGYDKGAHSGDGDRFRWVNIEEGVKLRCRVVEQEMVVNKKKQVAKALKLSLLEFENSEISIPERMGSDIPILEGFLPINLVEFLQKQEGEIKVRGVADEEGGRIKFSGMGEIEVGMDELPKGWRVISKKVDFIFYDGWMLGARQVMDESIFDSGLPALEGEEAKQFARDINKKLENYEVLWQMIEFMNVLYVPNYQMSLQWRDQAEEVLRAKGVGMSHEEIREFVYYFWRSVHPAIHIKNLAEDGDHADQVVIINDDHCVKEVLSPEEVKQKYV